MDKPSKNLRGSASQYFVAGELCRRNLIATITLGNCPNTDILCSNLESDKLAHLQVKTFCPRPNGGGSCSVGQKAEVDRGENFFWILVGLPETPGEPVEEFYVIPSPVMAKNITEVHRNWLNTPGKQGQKHKDNPVRNVYIPPNKNPNGWVIEEYRNRWDLIEKVL